MCPPEQQPRPAAPTVLGLPGSLGPRSRSLRLLHAAGRAAGEGARLEVFPPQRLAAVPRFDSAAGRGNDAAGVLRAAVSRADALLLATPEHNGSFSGVLKDAIDWLAWPDATSPLRGMPAAVIGVSDDRYGGDWALADARKVLDAAGASLIDGELAVPYAETAFAPDADTLIEPDAADQLAAVVADLAYQATP